MQVLYKQILLKDEINELNHIYNEHLSKQLSNLITGSRIYCDIDLSKTFIPERLITVLSDYYQNLMIDRWAKYYSHEYGAVKPHYDINHDNMSNYTLLIYMTDDFEGGKLSIKCKRTDEDRALSQSNFYHNVYTITPKIGYGIIFKKEYLHWAEECYGNKNFLLIHFYN